MGTNGVSLLVTGNATPDDIAAAEKSIQKNREEILRELDKNSEE